jgi:uncharacterized membrane protein HdeD (DUF308 family)/predicted flap endonuclease-1-like 5' DNA nuclease
MDMSNEKTLEEEVGLPWWLVLISGISAILLGLLLFARPAATLIILIQILGIYWLISGVVSLVSLFWNRKEWGWKLFSGILGILAGIMIIKNPLWSTLLVPTSLAILIGAIGIAIGVLQLVYAFRGGGWGLGVLGALSILLGLLLLFRPVIAGLAMPYMLGGLFIGGGILVLIWAFSIQDAQRQAKEMAARAPTAEMPKETVVAAAAKSAGESAMGEAAGMAAAGAAAAAAVEASAPEPAPVAVESPASAVMEAAAVEAVPSEAALTGNVDQSDAEEMAKFKYPLEYVEGIGPAYAAKLKAIGLVTCLDLLKAGATRQGRDEIEAKAGIAGGFILKWVNHVDLYRIKGVGSEYADLLEVAGVDTVVELAQRNPVNLFQRMVEVNSAKNLVRKPPVQAQVEDWVVQAKGLTRVVSY